MVLTGTHRGPWCRGLLLLCLSALLGCAGQILLSDAPPQDPPPDPADLAWPPPPATPRLRWLTSFSVPKDLGLKSSFWRRTSRLVFGGPDDRLVRPQGISVCRDTIYLTDPGRPRVLVYAREQKRFTALSANDAHPWQVPTSVIGLQDGTLFVADAVGAVYRVEADLKSVTRLPWAELRRPVAVAVDESRDRLYVADAERHQILWGNLDGTYRGAIGRRGVRLGEFNFPTHLTVTADGDLYVTDAMNFRVQRFGPDGRPRRMFGTAGDGTGDFAKAKGVAIDSAGTIYVVDALNDVVQMFDQDGRFLMHFGRRGRRQGEFWLPNGIAIDAEDRVYVADAYNHRVQVFEPVRETLP